MILFGNRWIGVGGLVSANWTQDPRWKRRYWATPAWGNGLLFVPSHSGYLYIVDAFNGQIYSKTKVGWHAWGSPLLIGNELIVPLCVPGGIVSFDISDPIHPTENYRLLFDECIESTPS